MQKGKVIGIEIDEFVSVVLCRLRRPAEKKEREASYNDVYDQSVNDINENFLFSLSMFIQSRCGLSKSIRDKSLTNSIKRWFDPLPRFSDRFADRAEGESRVRRVKSP